MVWDLSSPYFSRLGDGTTPGCRTPTTLIKEKEEEENCVRFMNEVYNVNVYPNSRWPPGSWYVPFPTALFRLPKSTQPGWAESVTSTPTPTPGRLTTLFGIWTKLKNGSEMKTS